MQRLWEDIEADPSTEVTVDLVDRQVSWTRRGPRLRPRRLQPLAAHGRPRRHRHHRAPRGRDRGVRGGAQAVVALREPSETPSEIRRESRRDTRGLRCCGARYVLACGPKRPTGRSTDTIQEDTCQTRLSSSSCSPSVSTATRRSAQAALDAVIDTVYAASSKGEKVVAHRLRHVREARPRRPHRAQPSHRRHRQGEEAQRSGVQARRRVPRDHQRCEEARQGAGQEGGRRGEEGRGQDGWQRGQEGAGQDGARRRRRRRVGQEGTGQEDRGQEGARQEDPGQEGRRPRRRASTAVRTSEARHPSTARRASVVQSVSGAS